MPNDTEERASSYSARRAQMVSTIRSPLGFFALALLIVEAFLLGAGVFFQISPNLRIVMIIVGIALFLIVFGAVFWLVVKHPRNLVFSEQSHVEYAAMEVFGDRSAPLTVHEVQALPGSKPPHEPTDQLLPPKEDSL